MADQTSSSKKKRFIIKSALVFLVAVFFLKLYFDYQRRAEMARIFPSGFEMRVLGEEAAPDLTSLKKEEALASSENFNATQISVNGGVGLSDALIDFENSGLLGMSNVKSELYSVKDGEKEEVKAIISCQTNKKTIMEVEYLKSGEKNPKVVKDDYFSLNHMLIISALDPDSVYRYSVKVQDSLDDRVTSDQFVFYTGAPNISLMDVLGNATQKVFGWAMKK